MTLKPGDRVTIVDGLGNILCEAVVELYTGGATIWVRQYLSGTNLQYSVPISALESEELNTRPSLGEIVGALRTAFGLREQTDNTEEKERAA